MVLTEFAEFWDAGIAFYVTDFWSLWDLSIIATGLAFFIARVVGIVHEDQHIMDIAFDILSIEALFLVPRSVLDDGSSIGRETNRWLSICSVLSLHPYIGTLLPCLREMVGARDAFATWPCHC